MKTAYNLSSLLILLVLSSEHTCQEAIGSSKCDSQRCTQECYKEARGAGECRNNICICTYYCKQPPE
uniref:Defensin-like protein n=1 Tax=Nelumbo nucifera TaxID=4432 RepID=A0A822ZGG3_NELNU|nr:TPA_asm: hypothetical protein HUJ06_000366 [Nelumbo nucifera]